MSDTESKTNNAQPKGCAVSPCSEIEPEIIENATCDGCGNENTFVQVVNCPPVSVGICLCRGCLETDFQNETSPSVGANE